MRKLGSLLILILLVAAAWMGARYLIHRGEVKATIIMAASSGLRKGDPLVESGVEVGHVTAIAHLDGEDAVSVVLTRSHRRAIVTDSLFAVDGHTLVITNTVAVGAPVDNGAVLRVREDKVSRWLAKHGSFLDRFRAKTDETVDSQIAKWNEQLPEWKQQGNDALGEHLSKARAKVSKIEDDLRRSNHADEAKAMREKFDRWVESVKK